MIEILKITYQPNINNVLTTLLRFVIVECFVQKIKFVSFQLFKVGGESFYILIFAQQICH